VSVAGDDLLLTDRGVGTDKRSLTVKMYQNLLLLVGRVVVPNRRCPINSQ